MLLFGDVSEKHASFLRKFGTLWVGRGVGHPPPPAGGFGLWGGCNNTPAGTERGAENGQPPREIARPENLSDALPGKLPGSPQQLPGT